MIQAEKQPGESMMDYLSWQKCKILVSSCLLGEKVRYNGTSIEVPGIFLSKMHDQGLLVPFCPECSGGLGVPRPPVEIQGGGGEDVLAGNAWLRDKNGKIYNKEFLRGARKCLALCKGEKIEVAILTENSPSCGSKYIYDGEFAGVKVAGLGVTAALLQQNGIAVFTQWEIETAYHYACRRIGTECGIGT